MTIGTGIGKALATLALAVMCGCLMYWTKGAHGIGWFVLGLLLIEYPFSRIAGAVKGEI